MAHLAQHWVEDHIKREIESFDQEASNGYLFGELLLALQLIDKNSFASFVIGDDEDSKVRNFTMVEAVLKRLGIKHDPKVIAWIITEQYGSAASLFVKIKDWTQANKNQKHRSKSNTKNALVSIRHKKWKREAVQKGGHAPDFLTKIIHDIGFENYKALDMAVHLKKYEDRRRDMEGNNDALEAQEALVKRNKQAANRALEIQKAHNLTTAHDAEDDVEKKHWQETQANIKSNFKKLLQYELYQVESRKIKSENQRLRHRLEEIDGIEWFEKNLLRFGVGGDDMDNNSNSSSKKSGSGNSHARPSKEGGFAFLDRIRANYEDEDSARKRHAGDMMAELREKADARRLATKEKEIRKRREKCDRLEAERASASAGQEDEVVTALLEKINLESKHWEALWSHQIEKERRKDEQHANQPQQQGLQQQSREEAAVAKFLETNQELAEQAAIERQQWQAKYEETLTERAHVKSKKLVVLVRETLHDLITFAVFASEQKAKSGDAAGAEPLPSSAWIQLKKLFVAGHDFFPSPEDNGGKDRFANVSLLTHAEASACAHQWKHGRGAWGQAKTEAMSDADHEELRAQAASPEVEILDTIQTLLADVKPVTKPKSSSKERGSKPPLRFILSGSQPHDLLPLGQSLCDANNLLLATPEIAIARATSLVQNPTEEDAATLPTSRDLQALQELGNRYIAITTDPKRPQPATEQLMIDLTFAFIKCFESNFLGYLIVGYPTTLIQAKLLERKLTNYSDPELEHYLKDAAKGDKKRGSIAPPSTAAKGGVRSPVAAPTTTKFAGGFVAVFHIISSLAAGEADAAAAIASFYHGFDDPTSEQPYCYTLSEDEEGDDVPDSLDILVEMAYERHSSEDKNAPTPTTPSLHWKEQIQRKQQTRALQCTKAERMWKEHLRKGGKALDLDHLRTKILEPWNHLSTTYRRQMHQSFVEIVSHIHPIQQLEVEKTQHLQSLCHAPFAGVGKVCIEAAKTLTYQAPKSMDDFLNDVEIQLGDLVEERYRECVTYVEQVLETSTQQVDQFLQNMKYALGHLVEAQGIRLEGVLDLITTFDQASNVSVRATISPSSFPLHSDDVEGGMNTLTRFEEAKKCLLQVTVHGQSFLREKVLNAVWTLEFTVRMTLSKCLSDEATAQVEVAVCQHLDLLRSLLCFSVHLVKTTTGFSETLCGRLKAPIGDRNRSHYEAISNLMCRLSEAQNQGAGARMETIHILRSIGQKGSLEQGGIAVTVGPTVLNAGRQHVPLNNISVLVDSLRVQACRSPFIKLKFFVDCIVRSGFKNACWQDRSKVEQVAKALDPLETGVVLWRRFVHSMICASLTRLPTVEELMTLRSACFEKLGLSNTVRRGSKGPGGEQVVPVEIPSLQGLRITTNDFLDLPLWFEENNANSRAIRELYALAFTEDDGKLSMGLFLLHLCETRFPTTQSSSSLSTFTSIHPGFIKALLLFCNNAESSTLQEDPVSSKSAKISTRSLYFILANGTYLHREQEVNDFMGGLKIAVGGEQGGEEEIPLQDLLVSERILQQARTGGLLSICDLYE